MNSVLRVHCRLPVAVALALAITFATVPVQAQTKKPARPGDSAKPAEAEAEDQSPQDQAKDARLTIEDLARMRRARLSHDKIVEKAAEQGVRFETTPTVQNQLRRMGFKPQQIEALKDAYQQEAAPGQAEGGAIIPGKGLSTTDAQRDQVLANLKKITKLSSADVQPVQTQHITLWAARDVQAVFLADLKKLETFLRTKCKEPLRSGLDKRSAHVVLISRRYEFEKWVNAMFEVLGEQFKDPNNPNGASDLRASVIKGGGLYSHQIVLFLLEERKPDFARRSVAAGVGYMYLTQLAESQYTGPLATGFANGTECILAGTPSVMIFSSVYGMGERNLGADPRAWIRLVQQRIATKQASSPSRLFKMDTSNMTIPHYAEAWTITSLLARQPGKFGELLLKLREEPSQLKAIEDVYDWNEQKLTEEWHKYVLGQR